MRDYTLSVRVIQPVLDALDTLGMPGWDALAVTGLPRRLLDNPDARVPHSSVMRLWDAAEQFANDESVGLRVAEATPLRSFGLHAFVMLTSPSLREAYRRTCRYQRLVHDATSLTFDEGAEFGELRHSLPGGRAVPRQPAEFLAAIWLLAGRRVTDTRWIPADVRFAHPMPRRVDEYVRVFGIVPRFSREGTALRVSNDALDTPNPRADLDMLALLDRYAALLLERVPSSARFSDRTRARLAEAMASGRVATASQVAKSLNVSVRTLHRELAAESTTVRELLQQLRRERAMTLLADSRYSISEIAYLLGYAELSPFYRAFRRWTGRTPAAVRAEVVRQR